MSFAWSDYFDLAQELARRTAPPAAREARLRSAISRAYYAAFCLARNHLRKEGRWAPQRSQSVHSYLIRQLKNSPERTRSQLGQNLDRLRADRVKADYDDSFPRLDHSAPLDILLTQQVLSALAKL